jgi:CTP:molybdopterin cytidylyltransferase MocA
MKVQIYLLNKTYIAEDKSTGLVAYADTPKVAEEKLRALVAEYWEREKIIIPINVNKPEKDIYGS